MKLFVKWGWEGPIGKAPSFDVQPIEYLGMEEDEIRAAINEVIEEEFGMRVGPYWINEVEIMEQLMQELKKLEDSEDAV